MLRLIRRVGGLLLRLYAAIIIGMITVIATVAGSSEGGFGAVIGAAIGLLVGIIAAGRFFGQRAALYEIAANTEK